MFHRLVLSLGLALTGMFALPAAPALAQMDAREMELCRQQCMARARDASDPRYRSCVRTRCEGQPAARTQPRQTQPRQTQRQAAPAAAAAAALGTWALGSHPALGVSAHVQTETGVIGLACAPEGAAIRVTNGLFRGASLGWITDTGTGGGTVPMAPGALYSEITGSACALGLPGLMAANALVLVDAPVVMLGAGKGFALRLPGGDVPVRSGAEVQARLPGVRNVPVPGLAAALGSLAQSCPGLAQAMAQPCP
jgi:hypothetical protein